MEWEKYISSFRDTALEKKRSEDYIQSCICYAKKLYDKKLPIIYDVFHLSKLVGYELNYIYSMSYSSKHFYRTFEITKKSGGTREINEPLPDLKRVQSWILSEILNNVTISPYAKAYVSNLSIKDNARFHRKQSCLVTLDIHDFFGSISFFQVRNIFISFGYGKDLSTTLANLCCFKGRLPQGAPTSAYISNIYMLNIDKQLAGFTQNNGWRYTRYADDMSFSGDVNVGCLLEFVHSIVKQNGLQINSRKTRIAKPNSRQIVTGIVVNQKMQITKTKRKFIRQQLYYIKKYGIDSHLSHIKETRKNYLNHILGLVNQALFINPKDNEIKEYQQLLISIVKMNHELN